MYNTNPCRFVTAGAKKSFAGDCWVYVFKSFMVEILEDNSPGKKDSAKHKTKKQTV